MPFEPKLVESDDDPRGEGPRDDGAEFDLPHDCQLLAAGLRADARMLAEQYPPEWSESDDAVAYLARIQRSTRATSRRRTAWWSMVAAAAVLILALGLGAWYLSTPGGEAQRQVAGPSRGDGTATSSAGDSAKRSGISESETARPAVSLERAETLLIHVSGPELEGLLDLIEAQDSDDPLLSI